MWYEIGDNVSPGATLMNDKFYLFDLLMLSWRWPANN